MGKKIFVTYKYSDSQAQNLPGRYFTTVRHYVDKLQEILEEDDHINKGEDDGTDLSDFKDSTIASKLRDKIYDSSVTIVLISKGMKDSSISENDQWIPWEVAYSLRESSREGRTSPTNAMLAVVLPDESSSYEYFMKYDSNCDSYTFFPNILFNILKKNMFNKINQKTKDCNGTTVHMGYFSYIYCVEWEKFKRYVNYYINVAVEINENRDEYNITKTVD